MLDNKDVLVIADGAAFGALIENCVAYFETQFNRRISLWLPESFEYLILKSGVIKYENLDDILENTSKYVECEKYVSWERFFTDMLIDATRNKREKYLKDTLNEYYLEDAIAKKIIVQMPKDIQEKREIRIS